MYEVLNTDVLIRAKRGDSSVISALYERYHKDVFRYLYYRVSDQQAAEDLTSEVFLRMIHALEGYRSQNTSFQAWLFQIARNLAIDYYRKMNYRNHLSLEENLISGKDDPDTAVDHHLDNQRLRLALTQINDVQRDVIVMRFVAGMPIAQVAQALHKSEDSIKAIQRRGLAALRAILTDWEVSYD